MTTFNKEQQSLIDAPLNKKVVGIAGAGTGKTTTVLARVKRILTEYQTGRVVLITFTRMAANDMKKRLLPTLDEKQLRRVVIGTFHSVITQLIRENAVAVGLQPSLSVLDEGSTTMMYQSIIESNDIYHDKMTKFFVTPDVGKKAPRYYMKKVTKLNKKHYNTIAGQISTLVNTCSPEELETGKFTNDTYSRLYKMYNMYKNEPLSNESEQEAKERVLSNFLERIDTYYDIFKSSLSLSRETNTINYDQILFLGYLMVKNGLLDTYADSIVNMIVDEYQDTNMLQDKFVRLLGKNKLTLIGDADQNIYEFRGGRPNLIVDHAKEGITINLVRNYRSYQPILDIANNIIEHNTTAKEIRKPLIAHKELDGDFGGIVKLHSYKDKQESAKIIQMIKLLQKKDDLNDIAILVRSRMGVVSINKALVDAKIPINDTTKFADFMKSEVMLDALNFIKIFTNPKDIYAFMNVINKPKRGLGPKAIQEFKDNAEKHSMTIIEYLLSDKIKELTPKKIEKVQDFIDVYKVLTDPNNQMMKFNDMMKFVFKKSGYLTWIDGLKNKKQYHNNLTILYGFIEDFMDEYSENHANYTLFDIANAFAIDMQGTIKQENKDGVTIATIHGAKGLEWKNVFLIGMENEIFPGRILDTSDMESERRLMYVAVTRAKNRLWVCDSTNRITYGSKTLTESPFLLEMGNDIQEIQN